ncbi:MAG: succinylglutamate desuccinylase/aspartoacylase family protein [Pseudomonadota bacterium]
MQKQTHKIAAGAVDYAFDSFHYGNRGVKITLQASLHADELPGIAVCDHLMRDLQLLEQQNAIIGQICVVPIANPLGLSQRVLNHPIGRFDLDSGENYNRGFSLSVDDVLAHCHGKLGDDGLANRDILRRAAVAVLAKSAQAPQNPITQLRTHLQRLAIDADIVLDFHCDNVGPLHCYTNHDGAELFTGLMQYMQGSHVLLADD